MTLSITWIGQPNRDESQFVWEELIQTETCTPVDCIAAAKALKAPDVLILAMSRPKQYSAQEVTKLQSEWPSTTIVYLLGDWCCGEKRVSPEHTRVPSFYLHQLQPGNILKQILHTDEHSADLDNYGAPNTRLSLAIYARSSSYRAGIAESLTTYLPRQTHLQFGDRVRTEGVDVVIWEASSDRPQRASELKELKQRHPNARIIALVSYPRDFEIADLHVDQITVVAQPFLVPDLLSAVDPEHQVPGTKADLKLIA